MSVRVCQLINMFTTKAPTRVTGAYFVPGPYRARLRPADSLAGNDLEADALIVGEYGRKSSLTSGTFE